MATFVRPPQSNWFQPATMPRPLSSAACKYAWRLLAKWFCGHGFAWVANAALSFFYAPAVIVDSATAAALAAIKPGAGSNAAPTGDINRVRKVGSIIATGSGSTVTVGRKRA
jgi:hypothetical protein